MGLQIEERDFRALGDERCRVAWENGIPFQAVDTWSHSQCVWSVARRILAAAERAGGGRCGVDASLVELLCHAHDLGRMFLGSEASRHLLPRRWIGLHGVFGAAHFRGGGAAWASPALREAMARICERHLLGVGVTAAVYARWREEIEAVTDPDPVILRARELLAAERYRSDTLPESTEERVVAYADLCTRGAQVGHTWVSVYEPYEGSPRRRLLAVGGEALVARGDRAHAFVLELTGGAF